ncbi:MAG: hypothetical protein ACR2G0_02640 [Chthoniobacterales bacterium]
MRRRILALFVSLAFVSLFLPAARAAEDVWSGLVVATNVSHPTPPPPEMHRLHATLQRTFGYNQFELIGQSTKTLRSGEENWLAASKHFSLHVDARGGSDDVYKLRLLLYQDRQVLLETDATLSKSSPLVIKGPQIGSGQLLLLLVLK